MMTVETRSRSPRPDSGPVIRTTPRQNLITVLLATWMTLGGVVDGYAHRNLDTPETFFTPWHGILYTGYLAVAGWLVWLVVRNRPRVTRTTDAIPQGYGSSLAGVVVFFAGGLGDLVWHIVFGIEVSIDALLSPTHLLLLVGALLILSGPIRAGWADLEPVRSSSLVPALAVTMGASQLGFFFQYMDGTSARFMDIRYVPGAEEGYYAVVAGVGSIMITTFILAGAMLLLMRRGPLPFGAGTLLFGGFGLLMELLEGFSYPGELITPVLAGVVADVLIRATRPGPDRLGWLRGVMFLVPVVMWSVFFALYATGAEINWPVEVWSGLIIFTGLAGVGLSLIAFPPIGRRA
jgi:hypothetical protein